MSGGRGLVHETEFQTPLSVEEKLSSIEKIGTLEDDKRFYEMLTEEIESNKGNTDFEKVKSTMKMEIARKYIKDFIELRKALKKSHTK